MSNIVPKSDQVDAAVSYIVKLFSSLTEEQQRDALKRVTENRCRQCFDYDPNGNFWCCYESREYP